jgi:capsular exopolysaccharide synthesis family protein
MSAMVMLSMDVRAELRAEAERIAAALANELDVLRGREARLERRVAELEAGTIDQRRLELQLRELERAAESSRAVYENFLERFTEMAQQEEIQQADARVLTPADVPGAPDATRRNSTVMAGGIGGMLLGVGLVFLLDRLNNTFRGVGQLEQATTLPVTASLPLIRPGAKRSVVAEVSDRPASPLAEAMRHLRTSILLSDLDHPPKVVMITSAVPGEGKSTTSALLALTGTTAGQSAVVVDADLRHSALSAMLGDDAAARGPGLVGVLEGSAGLADAVVTDATTGLQVLPAGARLTGVNAADVLASQRFHRLVDELRARYDLVVVDTPPTLAVTDARIVATLVDAVVFAVHWDRTPRAAALDGLRELYSVDAPVIGTALTLVNEAKAARYAYGGYGSYYGKYRGAYAEA